MPIGRCITAQMALIEPGSDRGGIDTQPIRCLLCGEPNNRWRRAGYRRLSTIGLFLSALKQLGHFQPRLTVIIQNATTTVAKPASLFY